MNADDLRQEILGCTQCSLHRTCTNPVPFRGLPSRIMIVGEAPGRQEDVEGKPFVGPSGQLLWTALAKRGLERKKLFAANAVSCYPNGTPSKSEVFACRGNLYKQVQFCYPEYILALGRVANWSLGNESPINEIRGEWYTLGWFTDRIDVFPTYHPAAVLRNRALTRKWLDDLHAFADKVIHRKEVPA